jgi:hypothetical protein
MAALARANSQRGEEHRHVATNMHQSTILVAFVQVEYFPDTRSSGVTVGQLASGTSWAASEIGGRSH